MCPCVKGYQEVRERDISGLRRVRSVSDSRGIRNIKSASDSSGLRKVRSIWASLT
ncbi:hypothetical protein DPMN_072506 [Dreissena polymorpha]|uniref:Uncharacterized protein n=1 Tax=Dreissena polymorpha TaxID=45954 RepID=A0A9D3Z8T3_DREPO|nr:hypothetical protein DPMN_072506 [Dreissena polymorpha]